jgi:CheY-like chemotaxis protein
MTVVTERKPVVVLIVEDDHDMRSLLCDELWSEGYQLREAKDGDEALQLVLQSMPDLILTDLKMPAGIRLYQSSEDVCAKLSDCGDDSVWGNTNQGGSVEVGRLRLF